MASSSSGAWPSRTASALGQADAEQFLDHAAIAAALETEEAGRLLGVEAPADSMA